MNSFRRPLVAALIATQSALLASAALPVSRAALAVPDLHVARGAANVPVLWSSPATWGSNPPTAGDSVEVPEGVELILDVTPPPLAELLVNGELSMADVPIRLGADRIAVSGVFEAGTEASPRTAPAAIVLSNRYHSQGIIEPRLFEVLPGGVLDVHGKPRSASWLHLDGNVPAGSSTIQLESAVDWSVRDRIVIASTDFDLNQAEERTITGVSTDGKVLTLDRPLDFLHWGSIEALGVDERAEVGLVNRNVTISGAGNGGGHMRFLSHHGSTTVRMSWAELDGLGIPGELGQYPIHFHHFRDGSGSYVDSLSIHHSRNRAVTLHATDNVLVKDCLAYETLGHAFFIEDGSERNNRLEGNLGLSTRAPAPLDALLASDFTPSTYWISATGNTLIGNVAAGAEGYGFWYDIADPINLHDAPTFHYNVAHSNGINGYYKHDYLVVGIPLPAREFIGFTAYKNRLMGIHYRAADLTATWRDIHLADNATGVFFASTGTQIDGMNETVLLDSFVVGETDNIGTPVTSWEHGMGRSLPESGHARRELLGHELYEGRIVSSNTVYANFERAPVGAQFREAAAFGHVRGANKWAMDPRMSVSGLQLVQAQPVYLKPSNSLESGKASFILHDTDGTLTGVPGQIVSAATDLITPPVGASYNPLWNANLLPPGTRHANLRFSDRGFAGITKVTALSTTRGVTLDVASANQSYFPMTVLLPDEYALIFESQSPPRDFDLQLLFGYAGDSTIVTMRYAAPAPQRVRVHGTVVTAAASKADLRAQPGSGFAYDASLGILHIKLEMGGSGATMLDGLEAFVDVLP